jgi:hypothetical protein
MLGGFEFLLIVLNLLIPGLAIVAVVCIVLMLFRLFAIGTEILHTLQRIEEELRRRA